LKKNRDLILQKINRPRIIRSPGYPTSLSSALPSVFVRLKTRQKESVLQ